MATRTEEQRTQWEADFRARCEQDKAAMERRLNRLYRWLDDYGFSQGTAEEIDNLEYELAELEIQMLDWDDQPFGDES